MGMTHSHGGSAQDFEIRLSKGEFVLVGFDEKHSPLYMLAETRYKPFWGLTAEQSRTLHAFSQRKGGAK